jgi:glycosyltransferase involved in cell wall biosynthesis
VISIVVPAYDARADLPMCLASLLIQSFEDWECVIVDDGSREPLDDLVHDFGDPRLRLVRHPTNRGRGAARATGLAATSRPLVAAQDAHDRS